MTAAFLLAGLPALGWYALRQWRGSRRPALLPPLPGPTAVRVLPRWTAEQQAGSDRAFREHMAALRGAADGTPATPGVYVVTCPSCTTQYCTTLDGAIQWAGHFAHIDAGPLWPFIDAEIHQAGDSCASTTAIAARPG
jgi:hypothetical protein